MTDKCSRCGYSEFPNMLQIHHMNHDKFNNNPNNLILLCMNCHFSLHRHCWRLEDIGLKTPPRVKRNANRPTPEEMMRVATEKPLLDEILERLNIPERFIKTPSESEMRQIAREKPIL